MNVQLKKSQESKRRRIIVLMIAGLTMFAVALGLLLVTKSAQAAIASDNQLNTTKIMPDPDTATQNRDAHLEIAQVGEGNTLDAHEAWGKYYFDPSKVSDATIGISKGGYGGVVDTLGTSKGKAGVSFANSNNKSSEANVNAVRYEFYLAMDYQETDGWYDEIPCRPGRDRQPSLTVKSGQMSPDGWYKIDAARFVNNARCGSARWGATQKSGKYVLFVRAVWDTSPPVVNGTAQGRVNAFKLGAAYATKSGNPLTGYWADTRWAYTSEKPTTGAYSVQDRKSDNNTNGDYTFTFAPDCRLAVGQKEARWLHWSDVDWPAYYRAPWPVQPAPEFDLMEIPPGGGSGTSVLHKGPEDNVFNGLDSNGNPKQNVHHAAEFKEFKGGFTYKWVWKNIARVDGVTFWIPYDDFPAINSGGCGQWNHDFSMLAGPDGQLGTSEFKVAGGHTAVINLTQTAAGQDAGPNTHVDLTVAATNGKSIATTFSGVSASLNGSTSPASTAYSRVIEWKDLGRLGPAPTYTSSRNNIYAYFDVKPDAPDGARYCASAIMGPKSNTNLGGLKSTPEQICFVIDNSLKPYVTTTGADVHAGDCRISPLTNGYGDITGPKSTQAQYGSQGLYVVSAGDAITSFGSGGSAISNALTFGNGGRYGCMKRPDWQTMSATVEADKTRTNDVKTVLATGNSFDVGPSSLPPIGKQYIVQASGDITITGTAKVPVTIYAPNGSVTINGATFGGDTGTAFAKKDLPVTAVIARDDIKISKDTVGITALLYAGRRIDTCYEVGDLRSAANVNTCKNILLLNGFAMAERFGFKRTRAGSNGLQQSEVLAFNAAFYLSPPPGTGSAVKAVKYLGERAPLY